MKDARTDASLFCLFDFYLDESKIGSGKWNSALGTHIVQCKVKIANGSGEMRCSVQLPVSLISFHKSLLLVFSMVSETETVTHSFIVK